MARELVHGTCVALGDRGVLLRGESGAGKSDLALRFLSLDSDEMSTPRLVADDQVWLETAADGSIIARGPETLAGLIEVRGIGIVEVPHMAAASVALVCDLVASDRVPRLPPEPPDSTVLLGVSLPSIKLAAFEASAPLKLKMALLRTSKY